MQSTAVSSGTHPQPPHCHTPCKPAPPSSSHAPSHFNLKCCCSTSQLHIILFSAFDFKNAQLDLISHFIIHFIIDNFGFSCISFLHSSLTFLQATLSNIPFMSASDNSLITPTLTSCHPLNLPTHLPILLIHLPFSYSTA